eukprot:Partr_v1_DN26984_c1_g1_i2_m6744 putative Required for meiotic nuclear division 5 homolog
MSSNDLTPTAPSEKGKDASLAAPKAALGLPEFQQLLKKQKVFHSSATSELQSLLQKLNEYKSTSGNVRPPTTAPTSANIQSAVKDYYSAINKVVKAVDRRFTLDLDLAGRPQVLDGMDRQLNSAIAMHLVREGHFELADLFSRECSGDGDESVLVPEHLRSEFQSMFVIRDALRSRRDLGPALKWCGDNAPLLESRSSPLAFQLHKLQFVMILAGGSSSNGKRDGGRAFEALRYARAHFHQFGERHLKEIQRLMASLAYSSSYPWHELVRHGREDLVVDSSSTLGGGGSGASGPYVDILEADFWRDIEELFVREFCSILGLSQVSPLRIISDVGAPAVPTMIKLHSVMDDRRREEMWSAEDELPVPIPLAGNHRYHSIFACPVSREQSTATNPPLMLTCGHVIAKESVIRLSKGGKGPSVLSGASGTVTTFGTDAARAGGVSATGNANDDMMEGVESAAEPVDPLAGIVPAAKIKCPYCPTESLAGQARLVHF